VKSRFGIPSVKTEMLPSVTADENVTVNGVELTLPIFSVPKAEVGMMFTIKADEEVLE